MAATAVTTGSEDSPGRSMGVNLVTLLFILVVSGVLLLVNYWLALFFFFGSSLAYISLNVKPYRGRNLWLLLLFSLFVAIFVGSLTQLYLANAANLAAANGTAGPPGPGDETAVFSTAVLAGVAAALFVVVGPFLVLVALATVGVLRWHEADIGFLEAYQYLLGSMLGIYHLSITVENGEFKGSQQDKERLESFGGPGWLIVYPGQVVVLHRRGRITRIVGHGSTMLRRHEQVRAVVPITPKGNVSQLDNVLTRDRIPLNLKVVHVAQVEPAAETRTRLEEEVKRWTGEGDQSRREEALRRLQDLNNDHLVGDEYEQVYESIARRAAIKAPNPWEAMKAPVLSILKDVMMTCDFEELFTINPSEDQETALSINDRKIAEIERTVLERAREVGPGSGLMLKMVDINEVMFPPQIQEKINEEVTALVDARIREAHIRANKLIAQHEADARQVEAQAEEAAARYKAGARLHLARAEAQAETLKAEARAEYYRRMIQTLKEEGLSDETIRAVLQNLAASTVLEDELRRVLSRGSYRRGDQVRSLVAQQPETRGES